jgi:hypothetical protein
MTEVNAELLDSDLLRDAEATNQRPALVESAVEGDELKTTRLPPLTPPPPPMTTTMMPPPMPPPFRPSAPAPTLPLEAVALDFPREPVAPGKPSWLKALLTPTVPPPSPTRAGTGLAPVRSDTAGAVLAGLGLVFALLALVTGLRGIPDASVAPVVAAAVVLARALVTLGAGALSFMLFRSAERLLVGPSDKG